MPSQNAKDRVTRYFEEALKWSKDQIEDDGEESLGEREEEKYPDHSPLTDSVDIGGRMLS